MSISIAMMVFLFYFRYLEDNEIQTIEDKVFDNLGNLWYLFLQNNQLTYFHTLPASSLFYLNLRTNNIETIGYGAFTDLADLQYL